MRRCPLDARAVLAGVLAAVAGCLVLAGLPGMGTGLGAFVVVGVLLLPALPIVLELSERASGPSAGAAAGLVWMAGQLGALVVTGLAGLLVDAPAAAFAFGSTETTATTASPKRSSGTPTTRQSCTDGCSLTASSTSSGKIFSPPELMTTEPRPSRVMVPSASTDAKSPGTDQRAPAISGKVAADFSGSL